MAYTRYVQGKRPSYTQTDPAAQLAVDGMRHNLDQINGALYLDGALLTNLSVVGNVDYLLVHNLNRPVNIINVIKVVGVNQVIVRLTGNTVPRQVQNPLNAVWIRPSASGVIDLWVS